MILTKNKTLLRYSYFLALVIKIEVILAGSEWSRCSQCNVVNLSGRKRWYTGSVTPYESFGNLNRTPLVYRDYKPIKMWIISRHGTRYPGQKTINNMYSLLRKVKTLIQTQSKHNPCYNEDLRNWSPSSILRGSKQQHLTERGKISMTSMGERFRKRFENFFPTELDSRTEVKFIKTMRAKESAMNFLTGLFGKSLPQDNSWYEEIPEDNTTLQFDSHCFWWKYKVKKSAANKRTMNEYKTGFEMNEAIVSIGTRCLLPNIKFRTFNTIYQACRFEIAWYGESPWCQILEEKEMKVAEYLEDLRLFRNDGYANPWNYKIACTLFKDMFEFLTSTSDTRVRVNFTYLSVVVKLLAHLGLRRRLQGEELTAHNYADMQHRKWRSSKFAGFGMNFTFVLYANENGEQLILVMLNERPVRIQGCPTNADLCPLKTFEELFTESMKKCFYVEWCRNEEFRKLHEEYQSMERQGMDSVLDTSDDADEDDVDEREDNLIQ